MAQFAAAIFSAVGSAASAAGSAAVSAGSSLASAASSAAGSVSSSIGSLLSTGGQTASFNAGVAQASASTGGSFSIGKALELGSSAASSLLAISSGFSQASGLEANAGQELSLAEAEELETLRAANRRREELLATVARQRVAFAASGIDLSSGIVGNAADAATRRAESEIEDTLSSGAIRSGIRKRRARQLLSQARGARGASIVEGLGDFGSTVARVMRRG